MSENTRKPAIRFKGFTDPWEQRKFKNIVDRITVLTNEPTLLEVEYEDINSGEGTLNKDLSTKVTNKTGILFENGDILYGKLRPYLRNWLYPQFKGIAVGDFWVLRARNSNSSFIYRLVQGPEFAALSAVSSGSKMPRADWSLISEYHFPIPSSLEEQHQIGSLFSSLDHLITLHQRKYDKLCMLKKSMLEKMFPKEGESVPEIRFAGFTDPWEQRKLGDITRITIGEFVIRTKQNDNGLYPVYNGGKSYTGFYDDFNNEANKVVISARGAAGFVNLVKQRFWGGNSCYSVGLLDNTLYDLDFIFQVLKINESKFIKNQQTANIPSVSKADVETFLFSCPTIDEQRTIGSLFSSLDHLITLHQRKLNLLKNIKKSMLDKMFV